MEKLKTYSFTEKNSSCVLILSAETEKEAYKILEETVKFPDGWRLEEVVEED